MMLGGSGFSFIPRSYPPHESAWKRDGHLPAHPPAGCRVVASWAIFGLRTDRDQHLVFVAQKFDCEFLVFQRTLQVVELERHHSVPMRQIARFAVPRQYES